MSRPAAPSDLTDRLQATRPQDRELAAAYLGDLLEAGALSRDDFRVVMQALIRAAIS